METPKRTARKDMVVVKNDKQGERSSLIKDMEGGRGDSKRPSCLEETD